jgi:predicted NACHT family NTPase
MQKADYFLRLMKQRTDALVATDEKLQQFLMWVNEKSLSVKVPYKSAAVRAFYFTLERVLEPTLDPALNPTLERDLNRALDSILNRAPIRVLVRAFNPAVDLAFDSALNHTLERAFNPALVRAIERGFDPALNPALERALNLAPDSELRQALQEIKNQLPDPDTNKEIFKQWWKANGQAWTRQLRQMMISHRNIGHHWQFSDQHRQVLTQYYRANKLLVACLNSPSNVTPAVQQEIEETLLLPIAEIQKYR